MNNEKEILTNNLLCEIAWEVCNQMGGIYTVIRSKVPTITKKWSSNYLLIGPYAEAEASTDFEEGPLSNPILNEAIAKAQQLGFTIKSGRWLVSGRPQTILIDYKNHYDKLADVKYFFWQDHHIEFKKHDSLMDEVLLFGHIVQEFLSILTKITSKADQELIAHFHEWMGGTAIPDLRKKQVPIRTVFTTHATLLGRYLAMNDPAFYDHLPFLDWQKEANHFDIESTVCVERACAHGAHVFTTVSDVTGKECIHLLGRAPDIVLPNGLNIERFAVLHEVQNLHHTYKSALENFIMGHFFQSYEFDLGKTLYFFTSGRFEYSNKGYDLTLEALARLNHRLQSEDSPITIVMFFITKQPFHSINPEVLNSRAMLDKINANCNSIVEQIKNRLYKQAAMSDGDHKLPDLNELVDDYWKLRHRRTIQSWKKRTLPQVVTHNLVNDHSDQLLSFIRTTNLVNNKSDNVKVVYHPDFLSSTNPLFGMEYDDFVRACHLGIFPSYYEPWGYTPLECLARGVAAVTSDLSGFGDYMKNVPIGDEEHGIYTVNRAGKSFEEAADQLCELLYRFAKNTSRKRIDMRNKSEDLSEYFDWNNLYSEYEKAYAEALKAQF